MAFTWRYERRDGSPLAGSESAAASLPAEEFPTQADAETWIGESWRELLDGGVDQVTLLEGEREVYGPMGLHPVE